jgi:hypothetical protein
VPPEWNEITVQDLYSALALAEERTEMIVGDLLKHLGQESYYELY